MIDEDVPVKVMSFLKASAHDTARVTPSSPDAQIARLAKTEKRILITLDKDFTNVSMYPPKELTIRHVQIHPPAIEIITAALQKLLALPVEEIKGLIILRESGHLRYF